MRRLPSLNALRAFRKVSQLKSVSAAAVELHVSQSAVSRFIKLLEDDLRVELFDRKNGFELTDQGKTLYHYVGRGFELFEQGISAFSNGEGVLRVKTIPTLALRWLLKQEGKPERVEFEPRWKGIEPNEVEFQVGIRYGLNNWSSRHALKLYDEMLIPVCTKDVLATVGLIEDSNRAKGYPIIHPEPNKADWRIWLDREPSAYVNFETGLCFDTLDNAIRAAVDGHGVVMADQFLVQNELSTGQLVPASRKIKPSGTAYFLVFAAELEHDKRLVELKAWLKERIKLSCHPRHLLPAQD